MNICDYCGVVTRDNQLDECMVCQYDLCADDIIAVATDDVEAPEMLICRTCMVRYYPEQEFDSLMEQFSN